MVMGAALVGVWSARRYCILQARLRQSDAEGLSVMAQSNVEASLFLPRRWVDYEARVVYRKEAGSSDVSAVRFEITWEGPGTLRLLKTASGGMVTCEAPAEDIGVLEIPEGGQGRLRVRFGTDSPECQVSFVTEVPAEELPARDVATALAWIASCMIVGCGLVVARGCIRPAKCTERWPVGAGGG